MKIMKSLGDRQLKFWSAVIIHSLFSLYIVNFFLTYPIRFPFVDDWYLISWAADPSFLKIGSLLQHLNGHQYILVKLYCYLLSIFFSWKLEYSAIIGFLIGSLGYFLLIWSHLKRIRLSIPNFLLATFGLSLMSLTLRQGQNYFMAICLGWMFAIFFIGLYYWSLGKYYNSRLFKSICLFSIFMAPMSIGLGLIVPLAEIVFSGLRVLKTRTLKVLYPRLARIIVSAVAIFISYIFPSISSMIEAPHNRTGLTDSLTHALTKPVESLNFFPAAIGQVFTPWSVLYLDVATWIGSLLLLGMVVVLYFKKGKFLLVLTDKNCAFAGFIFLGLFFVGRFKSLELLGVFEPRYTTGSLVVVIGVLAILLKTFRFKALVGLAILALALTTQHYGKQIGPVYYIDKYNLSTKIDTCFQNHKDLLIDENHPCLEISSPGEWMKKEEQIRYLKLMKNKKLALFSE